MTTFDLFSSVRDGNTDIVRRLLQSKHCRARLNERNEWGDTALHLAAEAGNGEICQMLIAAGASVTVRNNRGETCLHRAAVGGHVESVRAIVAGRDQDPEAVNSQNDAGYTALHHAAKHGSRELIEILVKAGSDHMLQNNAGETPYMVAHKFEHRDAERMLLDREQEHADRAIREMNRKEKEIIRAYLRAVKYASQLESRVRIMVIGDTETGKTSLKKTLFGEPYNPYEKPSTGIHADTSVTRITFKQYREWIQQPTSKADTHRLNLEYIDVIIDFILNFLKQPRIVADDGIDSADLQIEREKAKSVNFVLKEDVIPSKEDTSSCELSHDEHLEENEDGGIDRKPGPSFSFSVEQPIPNSPGSIRRKTTASPTHCSDDEKISTLSRKKQAAARPNTPPKIPPPTSQNFQSTCDKKINERDSLSYDSNGDGGTYYDSDALENQDDRLHRLTELGFTDSSNAEQSAPLFPHIVSAQKPAVRTEYVKNSTVQNPKINEAAPTDGAATPTIATVRPESSSSVVFNRPQREISRLLVEKMPLEILKRMVIRWPVGDEQFQDHSILNSNRLTITVWDVAGDPLQQNFIPLFFSNRCMFICMYNLTKELDVPSDSHSKLELSNVDGSILTNAQVLESWIGCATAFKKDTPSEPFRCTSETPLLPPIILSCSYEDSLPPNSPTTTFHRFFERKSFEGYNKHLVEANSPSALRMSNLSESISYRSAESGNETTYCGHHFLRREIDHLARQMPYILDKIPVQWVKFEQLLYGLQQQKKLTLLYDDLAKYVQEHCKLSGPLQVLPALAHFHDIGIIVHFYRHPELCNLIVTNPQWLANALSSLITSNPGKWVTPDVQNAFANLRDNGAIGKDNLQLAYRCARMAQRHWNEMLFILNCMDLICCHPSLHKDNAIFLPAMVTKGAPDPFIITGDDDPCQLLFSTKNCVVPIAIFNQLVTRCIRSTQYSPRLFYQFAHFQLNADYHLLLWKEHTAIVFLVQQNMSVTCPFCRGEDVERYEFTPKCSHISHLISENLEFMPTDNIATLIETSTNSGVNAKLHLSFPDTNVTQPKVCSRVLEFVMKNLEFLNSCWFPGLDVELQGRSSRGGNGKCTVLDQVWKHTVLNSGGASRDVAVWFEK